MTMQQLKYYVELSRYKSFTKAANALFITQQGLGVSMSRLETELSCQLFIHTAYGLQLTEQGEFFLEHAKIMLQHYNLCKTTFENAKNEGNCINIAAAAGTVAEFGSHCIDEYASQCPNISIKVAETSHYDCDKLVEEGDADLGFAVEDVDRNKFDYYRLFSAPASIIVTRQHPLAQKSNISLEDLDKVPMVLLGDTSKTSKKFLTAMEDDGLSTNIKYQVGEIMNISRLVKSYNIAGLSNVSVSSEVGSTDTVSIPISDERCCWNAGIIKRRESLPSSEVVKFFEYFKSNCPRRQMVNISLEDL
jgi:DNA-binding transcriptional LysR family regulator